MRLPTHILFYLGLAVVVLLLSVRPAVASGTVTSSYSSYTCVDTQGAGLSGAGSSVVSCAANIGPKWSGSFCSVSSCSFSVNPPSQLFNSGICSFKYGSNCSVTYNLGIKATAVLSCPSNSTLTSGQCICNTGFVPNSSASACQPELTPHQQAAQDAKAAALAKGYSPEAAQAASDAVTAHPNVLPADWPQLGDTSASVHDYATTIGVPATQANTIAQGCADLFASQAASLPAFDRKIVAYQNGQNVANYYLQQKMAGQQAQADLQLGASVAAGALAIGSAVAAAAAMPLTAALAGSAALHTAILAANVDTTNVAQVASVQSAGTAAIKSGATPLQVTLATQAATTSASSATTTDAAAVAGAAAVKVLTQPQSDWPVSSSTTTAQHQNAATAAATAAAVTASTTQFPNAANNAANAAAKASYSGLSTQVAVVAGQAAAKATQSGFSAPEVQKAADQAAARVANGALPDTAVQDAVNGVNGSATEVSLQKSNGLLSSIRDLLATTGLVDSSPTNSDGRAQSALDASMVSLNGQLDSANIAQEADEQSLLDVYVFDQPTASCSPWSGTIRGVNFNFDWCTYTEKLRALIAWLFALFGAYSIYTTIFKPRS